MYDSLVVGSRQTVRDLDSILNRLSLRQGRAIQSGPKALALQKLRHEKRRAVVLADIVNGKNIGVVQGRNRTRLLLEAAQAIRLTGERFG